MQKHRRPRNKREAEGEVARRVGSAAKPKVVKRYAIRYRTTEEYIARLRAWKVIGRFAKQEDRDHELAKLLRTFPAARGTIEYEAIDDQGDISDE